MSSPHLSVVIPAYNEEVRLPSSLDSLLAYYEAQRYSYEVTVVSDGSTDRTNQIAGDFAAAHPTFKLLAYQPNHGKGYAVRQGMLAAIGELVLFCDADLATPQEETDKLMKAMADGADVAIGSRPLKDSRLEKHQPLWRELGGRGLNFAIQLLAVKGIKDTQCGFKMFTRASAQEVFKRCRLDNFSFDFEALVIANDLGLKVVEIPIRWAHQEGSKVVPMRDGPLAIRDLIRLRATPKEVRLKEK